MEILPPVVPADAYPLRQEGVRTHLAGSEFVLRSEGTGELIALNETASALWERCDGSLDVAAVAASLAAAFERPEAEVLSAVRTLLSDFQHRGLVRLHLPPASDLRRREVGTLTHVTFLRHTVEVWTDDAEVADNLRWVFGALAGGATRTRVARLGVAKGSEGYRTTQDGVECERHATLQSAVTWVKWRAVRALVQARPDLLWFHAGAAVRAGRALVCVGEGGSGKSTLIGALVESGWAYVSDDIVPYDPVTGGVLPFPLASFRRTWPCRVVEDVAAIDKLRVDVEPARVAVGASAVSALVFPRFSSDSEASGSARGPAAAAVGLSEHALDPGAFAGDAAEAFCELASRARALDLVHTPRASPFDVLSRHMELEGEHE